MTNKKNKMIESISTKTDAYLTEEKKMMGFYLDQEQANQMSLFSFIYGKSKASIIKELIENFLSEDSISTKKLMEKIIDLGIKDWQNFKKIDPVKDKKNQWNRYEEKFRKTLTSKRIPEVIIEELIELIKGKK